MRLPPGPRAASGGPGLEPASGALSCALGSELSSCCGRQRLATSRARAPPWHPSVQQGHRAENQRREGELSLGLPRGSVHIISPSLLRSLPVIHASFRAGRSARRWAVDSACARRWSWGGCWGREEAAEA